MIPLPIIPMKVSAVECAADAKRSGANRSSSISNIVPSIVTDSTEQEILNNS